MQNTIPKYFKYAKFYFVHTNNIFLGFLAIFCNIFCN